MPLFDHFRSPMTDEAPWTSVGAQWIAWTIRLLNRTLPEAGFRAFSRIHLGNMAGADIGEYERTAEDERPEFDPTEGGPAAAVLPPPVGTLTPVFPDHFEVEILTTRGGMRLVAVLEFISPSNKARPDTRRKVADKCVAY